MKKWLCLYLLFFSCLIHAQEKKSILVKYVNNAPVLDGLADDEIWNTAEVSKGFTQYFPTDTALAVADTEIRMAYNDTDLLVFIKCESVGEDYVVPNLKRDFRAGGNDNITLMIDPFNDGNNAFMFGSNPEGVQREGLISGGGITRNGFSTSWDNKWRCASTKNEKYWTVEMSIPFNTLRYNEGSQVWKFNSYRFDMQANERSTWIQIPRNQNIYNLGYMGDLLFEKPLKSSGPNISLIPYATAGSSKDYEENTNFESSYNIGGDAKVAITSGLNLDITINPDFSQVEVDRQITNLDRFEIFFPERRQFFLENADLFGSFGFGNINPFFSRRIGITKNVETDDNIQNTIYAGLRLSGKISDKWRVGFLSMQTAGDEENLLSSNNYSVGAIQKTVGSRSNLGVIVVNRQATSDIEGTVIDKYNRVIGVDYNLATEKNDWSGKTFLHKSFTVSNNSESWAHGLELFRIFPQLEVRWKHEYVGSDYDAQVGFVRRSNYYRINPRLRYFFNTGGEVINRHGPTLEYEQYNLPSFGITDYQMRFQWSIEFKNNSRTEIAIHRQYLYLFEEFDPTGSDVAPLLADTDYSYTFLRLSYRSDGSKIFSFNLNPLFGQYYNGKRYGLRGNFNFNYRPYFSLGINYNYNVFDMPYLDENANTFLIGPRVDLTFNKSVFFTSFIQYNTQSDNTNINTRLQWRFAPASDFFLVFADNYFTGNIDPENRFLFNIRNRSIVLKMTYWLNL